MWKMYKNFTAIMSSRKMDDRDIVIAMLAYVCGMLMMLTIV